jgi:hypothetical protein
MTLESVFTDEGHAESLVCFRSKRPGDLGRLAPKRPCRSLGLNRFDLTLLKNDRSDASEYLDTDTESAF